MDAHSEAYEATHVHAVYDSIAPHFSDTRHSRWPLVQRFLQAQAPAAIGADVGTGNGKYLRANGQVFMVGSDRSAGLAGIAAGRGGAGQGVVVVADGLALPYREGVFDFAVCVAVVHHLATRERRVRVLGGVLGVLRQGGSALVYVWALEQRGSRRGWDEGDEQDVLVPWVMRGGPKAAGQDGGAADGTGEKVYHRFYHLYREGELEDEIRAAGGVVVEAGYEKDNWWAVAMPKPAAA